MNLTLTQKPKILFSLTGSIACFKACQAISSLVQQGAEVQVVASQSALKFVGEATLEGLSRRPLYSDLWQSGRMMDHIDLNRWADLVVVAPATANFLNKAAAGIADSLVETLFLAHDFKKPYLIAPAMNQAMYAHPATQASIQKLTQMGCDILPCATGNLACGEQGEGRMIEVDELVQQIMRRVSAPIATAATSEAKRDQKILITSGGTSEPIDDVRVITNRSTGATGAAIADALIGNGYQVTYLHAKSAVLPNQNCTKISFESFDELTNELCRELSTNYDAVIHIAAVSDFTVKPTQGKISSDKTPELKFKTNPKLVNNIREWSRNKHVKLIAFKLTSTADLRAQEVSISNLIRNSQADLIIHNDTSEIEWTTDHHVYHLHQGLGGKSVFPLNQTKIEGRQKLGQALVEYFNSSFAIERKSL